MKVKGHVQISGNLEAANFPQDVADFYGITVKQVRDNQNIHSYSGLKLMSFNDESFYITQNFPNTDEVLINFKGSSSAGVADHGDLTGLGVDDHMQYALTDRTRPTLWNVSITDGSNVQVDDTVNFNNNDFYVSTNLSGQPVINTLDKSVGLFMMSATQSSNLAVGDHLKFNIISFQRGSNISLDTTTTYTSSSSVASLGRITLQPHKIYEIYGVCRPNFTGFGSTGAISFIVSDDTGAQFGAAARQISLTAPSTGGDVGNTQAAVAIVAPTVATRYEIRLSAVTDLVSISGSPTSVSFVKVIEL